MPVDGSVTLGDLNGAPERRVEVPVDQEERTDPPASWSTTDDPATYTALLGLLFGGDEGYRSDRLREA